MQDVAAPSESSDKPLFETVNVLDSSICTTDMLQYAVLKGGQQNYTAKIGSSTASNSNIIFNVVVPSLENIISRTMYVECDLTYTFTPSADIAVGAFAVNWGTDLCLAPFPLQQCFQSCNLVVNNNSFSMDCQDVIDPILRTISKKTLREYADMCPVALDEYYNYAHIPAGAVNNPFNGYSYSVDTKYGRCSYQVKIVQVASSGAGGAPTRRPSAVVTVKCFEPLLMSPLAVCALKEDIGGFYGIQNMSLNITLSQAQKAFRSTNAALTIPTVSVAGGLSQNANLYLNYATPHPSMQLPARNVLNYAQMQVFKKTLPPFNASVQGADLIATPITSAGKGLVMTNTFQLNCVPDYLYIYIKKTNALRTIYDSDSYLPITGVSITFNNQPNICSQMSREQLYVATKKNGVNVSYPQFCGYSFIQPGATSVSGSTAAVYSGSSIVATSGSPVKLQMGSDINLISDSLSCGSIGSFNLLVEAKYWDNTQIGALVGSGELANYELIVVAQMSGIAVFQLGSSSTYMGLLDKVTVLNTSQKPAYNHSSISRKYGGGWASNLKGIFNYLKPMLKPLGKAAASAAKDKMRSSSNRYANSAANAMDSLGLGVSAGGMSGGSGKLKGRIM
jgi:hypothetical protein